MTQAYLRARYYDPSIGRFISEDPVKDGLNWYVYCANDPVNAWDSSGMKPTVEAAAAMADHIYTHDMSNDEYERTVLGWRLISVWSGRESMKMGFYIPSGDDWKNPSEYSIVFRGSIINLSDETIEVWKNNAEQYLSPKSADMWDAINYAKGFANSYNQEITFVGHSKGGAEALAAGVATNKNVIAFNPAKPNLRDYGLSTFNYRANASSYVVKGEILNGIFGSPDVGQTNYLPEQHKTPWYVYGKAKDVADGINLIMNHLMPAVKSALKEGRY